MVDEGGWASKQRTEFCSKKISGNSNYSDLPAHWNVECKFTLNESVQTWNWFAICHLDSTRNNPCSLSSKLCLLYSLQFTVVSQCRFMSNDDVQSGMMWYRETGRANGATVDPCNRGQYCDANAVTPDPGNCKQFFRCDNGYWKLFTCANGTLFDSVTLQCNHPEYVTCQQQCPSFTGSTTISAATIQPGNSHLILLFGLLYEYLAEVGNYRITTGIILFTASRLRVVVTTISYNETCMPYRGIMG